jgi:hypothetical protein
MALNRTKRLRLRLLTTPKYKPKNAIMDAKGTEWKAATAGRIGFITLFSIGYLQGMSIIDMENSTVLQYQ